MPDSNGSPQPNFQHGAALIVSMVMLVAITIIGVFVMSNSHLEWLMASNSYFQADANGRAMTAVQDGITWVQNDVHPTYIPTPPPANPRIPANWSTLPGVHPATSITSPGTNEFFVEYMGCTGPYCSPNQCALQLEECFYTYQVWGWATDSKGANRIVQATIVKKETTHIVVGPGQGTSYDSELVIESYAEID